MPGCDHVFADGLGANGDKGSRLAGKGNIVRVVSSLPKRILTSQEQQSQEQTSKSTDKLVGTLLDGRFQIEEVLGSGGMSVVYKATQLRVNRHVAIKTLRLQLDAKPVYRERFQREISLLCTLNHPHIVTVYDCVIGEDDQPYVVMDYLRGESLEAMIAKHGVIPIDRFARIVVQVCGALDHAHRKGVVHRDLKPGNIVLMDEDVDLVKVVDFGLAKLNQDNRRLTNSGELWASPPYMSPEQCTGKSEDERSDLYSLGCVMYEMLCGKDPFHYAQTVFELISTHVGVPPKSFAETNPGVEISPKIEAVVMKCLAKDPVDRYQNANELRDALIDACAGTRNTGDLLLLSNQGRSAEQVKIAQPSKVETDPLQSMSTSKYFNMAMDPLQGMNPEEAFAQSAPPANPAAPAAGAAAPASAAALAGSNRPGGDVSKPAPANVASIRGFEAPPARSNFGSLVIAATIGAAVVIGGAFAIPTMLGHKTAGSVTPNTVPSTAPTESAVSTASPPQPNPVNAPPNPAGSQSNPVGLQPSATSAASHESTSPVHAAAQTAPAPPTVHKKPPVQKPHVAAPVHHAAPPAAKPKHVKPPAASSGGNPWDLLQSKRTK
jgi:serine/threonine-protein kinase